VLGQLAVEKAAMFFLPPARAGLFEYTDMKNDPPVPSPFLTAIVAFSTPAELSFIDQHNSV